MLKSTPRSNYVKEFVDLINSGQVYHYFPEYKDRKLVPVITSFELPANIIKNLTKNKILVMATGDENMEIVNKEFSKHWVLPPKSKGSMP